MRKKKIEKKNLGAIAESNPEIRTACCASLRPVPSDGTGCHGKLIRTWLRFEQYSDGPKLPRIALGGAQRSTGVYFTRCRDPVVSWNVMVSKPAVKRQKQERFRAVSWRNVSWTSAPEC